MNKHTEGQNLVTSVTQNRDSIVDIESRLVDGLSTQEHLIEEIHVLQTNEYIIKRIIAGLVVAVTLSLLATGIAFHAAMEADRAVYQVEIIQRGWGLHTTWHVIDEP